MRHVKEIQVKDANTVRIILDEPDALFFHRIIVGAIAGWAIGAPRYMERVGWEGFLKRPIGTGPYMVEGEVKDYRKAQEGEVYATLLANPDYWNKGYPKIRKISFVQYPPKEALRAVIEGRVDTTGDLLADAVALRVTLDLTTFGPTDPKVVVEQILAIDHGADGNDHDSKATLGIAGVDVADAAGIGVTKTSTLTDGDTDTASDSATANITDAVML